MTPPLKKDDLILTNFNGRYSPKKIMQDSYDTNSYIARTAEMRQDYHYLDNSKYIVCNLGNITFTEFYKNYETLCPEFVSEIKSEFNFMVGWIDVERENNRKQPVLGHTRKEVFLNKIKQFPLN